MALPQPLPRDSRPHRRIRSSVRAGVVWAVLASAINLLIWVVATALSVPFLVWPGSQTSEPVALGPLAILGATLFAGLVAGLAVGLAAKVIQKVVRWVVVCGALLTIASLSAPMNQPPDVLTSTRAVLIAMHIVTGIAVTLGLARGIWTDDRAVRN